MNELIIDGYTFPEWCQKVKTDFLENGYDKMANDNKFVEKIADFCWNDVLCYSLEESLSSIYYTIEEEYNIHIDKENDKTRKN